MNTFEKSQSENLASLLKVNKDTLLFRQLEIDHLAHEEDVELIKNELKEHIPVFRHKGFMAYVKRIVNMDTAEDVTVLAGQNVIHPYKADALARWRGGHYPVSKQMFKSIAELENKILSGKIGAHEKVKGKVFHIYDETTQGESYGIPTGYFYSLIQKYRSFLMRRRFIPHVDDFLNTGKSRYQILHRYLDLLQEHGQSIGVIYCKPQTLAELALVLAQREGRAITLKELCPNLKLVIHYGDNLEVYKREIQKFLSGLNVEFVEVIFSPSGLLAVQTESNSKNRLTLFDGNGVCYSFVPEDQLQSDGFCKQEHDKFFSHQTGQGKRYLLLASNKTGLLMHSTNLVVEVLSKDPMVIQPIRLAHKLNTFNEGLTSDITDGLVAQMNESEISYGFLIREYIFADDLEKGQPKWVFEVNRPIQTVSEDLLLSCANSIHNELMIRCLAYRTAVDDNKFPAPEITFVSMGTFSTYIDGDVVSHIANEEALEAVHKILNESKDKVTLTPDAFKEGTEKDLLSKNML